MEDGKIDYKHENLAFWDERASAHAESADYNFDDFITNPSFISKTVDFDRPLLGDITNLKCIHLQCHIGTDTLSLARLGARHVTGLDNSSKSLEYARNLADKTLESGGNQVAYVQSDAYGALAVVEPGSFDLVFTGIGALCWLPHIREWAETVSALLKPGGRLFLREAHPILWTLDEKEHRKLSMKYSYFEHENPKLYDHKTSYVETEQQNFKTVLTGEFNHGLGEIVQALLDYGMQITGLKEHDSLPWEHLPGQMSRLANGEWTVTDRPSRLPHSYTLQAVKIYETTGKQS